MTEKVNFDLAEQEDVVVPQQKEESPHPLVPVYGSTEWSDYVLNLLTEDEKPNGNPTVVGLRRIVEGLLGEIVFTGPVQVFPSEDPNDIGRATVLYEIIFAWKLGVEQYVDLTNFEYPQKIFRDVGESWKGNTPSPFDIHAAATATSRAEGRVLRKALKLKCITAEEASAVDYTQKVNQDNEKASSFQKGHITSKCQALGIDVNKLSSTILEKLTHSEAVELLEKIRNYQQDPSSIPKEIKL